MPFSMKVNLLASAEEVQRVLIERIRQPGCHLPAHARPTHLLVLYQLPELIVRRERGSHHQTARFTTNDVGIYPAGEYDPISTNGPVDNITITIHQQYLNHFAGTRLNLPQPRLTDRFQTQDPLISAIGRLLLGEELTDVTLEPLYTESLTSTLCHHLLQHYTQKTKETRPETGKLPIAVLKQIDRFLDAHLTESISVEALAELAHCSPFHFSRLFKNTTGRSPYQYVLAHKAEQAKAYLRDLSLPITEIAYRLGFGSLGHFDRFFYKQTGSSPGLYRLTVKGGSGLR